MVIFGVIPRPPAAFSPFTMMKSIACCSFKRGNLRDDGAAAWLADDVAQEKNRQHLANMVLNSLKSKS